MIVSLMLLHEREKESAANFHFATDSFELIMHLQLLQYGLLLPDHDM